MKVKIVIKVPMHNDKDKSKALKIIAGEEGVSSVGIGKGGDVVEVVGEGVDCVCLAKSLRKKFRYAQILSVAEVKPPAPPPSPPHIQCQWPPPSCIPPYHLHISDSGHGPPPNCSIM